MDTGPVDLASGYLMLPITSSMAPKAKVIVFYVRPDGEVVADGLSFNVEGVFQNQVRNVKILVLTRQNLSSGFLTM